MTPDGANRLHPVDQGRFRIGLRVADVAAAAEFYRGFGFSDVGTIPATGGPPLMTILARDGALLILDALQGMPFADDERERQTQAGPRGLGVAVGIGVDDLEAAYEHCRANGCEIRCEPTDEPWGDRVFECVDPFGYVLEVSQPVAAVPIEDALAATAEHWRNAST
jgi:uncharacterized glyoxalase superfamily protein PhnB